MKSQPLLVAAVVTAFASAADEPKTAPESVTQSPPAWPGSYVIDDTTVPSPNKTSGVTYNVEEVDDSIAREKIAERHAEYTALFSEDELSQLLDSIDQSIISRKQELEARAKSLNEKLVVLENELEAMKSDAAATGVGIHLKAMLAAIEAMKAETAKTQATHKLPKPSGDFLDGPLSNNSSLPRKPATRSNENPFKLQ